MKKSFAIVIILFASIFTSYGQDSLFFKNSKPISAKVVEIGLLEVKYKLASLPDGPIYRVPRETIQFIRYSNGRQEDFSLPVINVASDKLLRRFIFGAGLNVGYLFDDGFTKFAQDYARNDHGVVWTDNNGDGRMNLGGRILLGVRLTRTFDINICGEFSEMILFVPIIKNKGTNFFFYRYSFGFIANKQFPLKKKLDFNMSGGLLHHSLVLKDDENTLYEGDGFGIQLQGGVNFRVTKLLTLQALLGAQFASSSASLSSNSQNTQHMPKTFKMDYSGMLFTFNVIFNK